MPRYKRILIDLLQV